MIAAPRTDPRRPATAPTPAFVHVPWHARAMGGRLSLWVTAAPGERVEAATDDASRAAARVGAWARRLTRFDDRSDLSELNRDVRTHVPVRPTLAAALEWAAEAGRLTDDIVNVTLLDERLSAEAANDDGPAPTTGGPEPGRAGVAADDATPAIAVGDRAWSVRRHGRGAVVRRRPGVRFDLDGIGKGWIADRALRLLDRHRGALVDADGDLAIRVAAGDRWEIGVEDPRTAGLDLAVLALPGGERFGLATSGVSVHRWGRGADARHHLIDPATGRPAETDVVQATVLARSARVAEALAKTAVILGSVPGLAFLDRAGVLGAIVLTNRGERIALPQTLEYLA